MHSYGFIDQETISVNDDNAPAGTILSIPFDIDVSSIILQPIGANTEAIKIGTSDVRFAPDDDNEGLPLDAAEDDLIIFHVKGKGTFQIYLVIRTGAADQLIRVVQK